MKFDQQKSNKKLNDPIQKERRSFLKKTAYAAPALIVLGQLARPTKAEAESRIPAPPVW